MGAISFAAHLTALAEADPDRPAVTCGADTLTRAELLTASRRLARALAARGVGTGDMVTIALGNSTGFLTALAACWHLGAVPQPVSSRLPVRELEAIIDLAHPAVVLGGPHAPAGTPQLDADAVAAAMADDSLDGGPLPDAVSPAWKAPTSGGSTGRPKLIVSGDPGLIDPDAEPALFLGRNECLVMPGPLYHNGPLVWASQSMLAGGHTVLLPRFDPEGTLAAIAEHRATVVYLVPTMMKRIWRLPDDVRNAYDLSSLRLVWHLAEPCPPWLKKVWIEWLGPDRIIELYAGTEAQAATVITGREWLEHEGSVGRPVSGAVSIRDVDGVELPVGEMGEVWLKSASETPTYRYVGAEARRSDDGFESLGDLGWVDADGYLYLGDRMNDMVLVGGANVYPAEVEFALAEHPAVQSVAVIGLPDDDLGNRLHAIVQPDPAAEPPLTAEALLTFGAERLARYKLPRTVELTDAPLRDEAGKVRRAALRAERLATPSAPADPEG